MSRTPQMEVDPGLWNDVLDSLAKCEQPFSDDLRELSGVALIKLNHFTEAMEFYTAGLKEEPANDGIRHRLAGF